jgi:dTDP-4-amino-4,6-dideoxygalactose transaminase
MKQSGSRETIPFMRLDRQFAAHRESFLQAAETVMAGGQVLQGPAVRELEERLCGVFGAAHCVALGSGTDAVTFAIAALGLPEGSRIAAPAMTFVASASGILHNRCVPVFVDVDPATMLMDEAMLGDLIDRRVVDAVVVVHLYGQMQNLDEIGPAAAAAGIPIIEDAAQALGSTRHGVAPGRHAAATCLSFDPTKVVGAYGSGGALLTDDEALAAFVRRMRYHGHDGHGQYQFAGYNSQLQSLQAALLNVKLAHLEAWQERRIAIAQQYLAGLTGLNGVSPMETLPGNDHNYHKFVLTVQDREALIAHLKDLGIQTKVHYPVPLHKQPLFRRVIGDIRLPKVEAAAERILSLPMYPEMTDVEVVRIVEGLRGHYGL